MVNRILGINNGVITINNRILDILMKNGKNWKKLENGLIFLTSIDQEFQSFGPV